MTEFEKAAEAKMQASFGRYTANIQVTTKNKSFERVSFLPSFTLIAASPDEAIKNVKEMYSMFPDACINGAVMRSSDLAGDSCCDYYKEIEHIKV